VKNKPVFIVIRLLEGEALISQWCWLNTRYHYEIYVYPCSQTYFYLYLQCYSRFYL